MGSTTSSKSITELRKLFSSYCLPDQLVSDNGPQFTSDEFTSFMKANGIILSTSSPLLIIQNRMEKLNALYKLLKCTTLGRGTGQYSN